MAIEDLDSDNWDGVWYDTQYGEYFTIKFGSDEIRLVDVHMDTPYHTYSNEEEFLNDAEEFHQLDPQTVSNPGRVIENALAGTNIPDAHDDIAFQYARDVTTPVDLEQVEDTVLDALDDAFDEVPPDGRLTKPKAREAVEDALETLKQ